MPGGPRRYCSTIRMLPGGVVLGECGPMRLRISAFIGKLPQPQMAMRAAEESFLYLERLAKAKEILFRAWNLEDKHVKEPLARRMIECVASLGEGDLTPMACVAGAISDAVADLLFGYGMTRVIVDNGGDIAIRCREGESVSVGIRPDVTRHEVSHAIRLDSRHHSWGVATSGLGGRSFTRGIATAATSVARTACMADAAATAIANAAFVDDENIIQRPAGQLDPSTDIAALPVTVRVGPLSEEKKLLAIERAIRKAKEFECKGLITGASVAVGGRIEMTSSFRRLLISDPSMSRANHGGDIDGDKEICDYHRGDPDGRGTAC